MREDESKEAKKEKEANDRSCTLLARRYPVSVIRDSVRANLAKERERESRWKNNTPPTSTRDIGGERAEANFNGQRETRGQTMSGNIVFRPLEKILSPREP